MTGPTSEAMALRVVTFNVRNAKALDGANAWPLRRRSTAASLQRLDADVVGLQEAYCVQERFLRRKLPDTAAFGRGRNRRDTGERCPVLWRTTRFELVHAEVRWYSDLPAEPGSTLPGSRFPRLASVVELRDTRGGRTFGVANTHLDERNGGNRERSADLLLGWLRAGIPWVVIGDLNTGPDSPPLRALQASGLRSVLPADAGGTNHDFTGRADGRRIDHILVSDAWEVRAAAVDRYRPGGRLPSDHWPLVADLVLP